MDVKCCRIKFENILFIYFFRNILDVIFFYKYSIGIAEPLKETDVGDLAAQQRRDTERSRKHTARDRAVFIVSVRAF
jgi:hypothetical protein